MEVLTIYKTKDGKKFNDKIRAERHERRLGKKTVHYIIDIAYRTVEKVYCLRVKDTIFAGDETSTRIFSYDDASGVPVVSYSINDNDTNLIVEEKTYNAIKSSINILFKDIEQFIFHYSYVKFLNPEEVKEKKVKSCSVKR